MGALHRLRVVGRAGEPVVLPAEVDRVLGHEEPYHLDRFVQTPQAFSSWREVDPQLSMLLVEPRRADPELQPAVRDVVDRDGLGGQDRRVAVGDSRHEGAQPKARRGLSQRREQCPGFEAGPARVAVESFEVVEDPTGDEARLLREARPIAQLVPRELMLAQVDI